MSCGYSSKFPNNFSMTALVTCCIWFSCVAFFAGAFYGAAVVVSWLLSLSGSMISGIVVDHYWYHCWTCDWTMQGDYWHIPAAPPSVFNSFLCQCFCSLVISDNFSTASTLGGDAGFFCGWCYLWGVQPCLGLFLDILFWFRLVEEDIHEFLEWCHGVILVSCHWFIFVLCFITLIRYLAAVVYSLFVEMVSMLPLWVNNVAVFAIRSAIIFGIYMWCHL